MDIAEVKAKKAELEKSVRDLLVQFSEETGLRVESVRFEMAVVHEFSGVRKAVCTSVKAEVEID